MNPHVAQRPDLAAQPATHGALADASHDREVPEVDLLSPLNLRGVVLRNRIAMAPMCQYSAEDGFANDWHLVHLGSRAVGGTALVMVEATAVSPEGRITPGDVGIWSDAHVAPLARIAAFVHGATLKNSAEGGWQVVAPSPVPFYPDDPLPTALD
ncbi:MAG: oxidoreductase, partial [Oxalobacteraceae bacterium]